MFSSQSNEKISLIYQLVKRDVSSRYRGSILGGSWLFISPLLMLFALLSRNFESALAWRRGDGRYRLCNKSVCRIDDF